MKTIEEKNLAIARFMGIKPRLVSPDVYSVAIQPYIVVTGNSPEKVMKDLSTSLRYHEDWSWLTKALEKVKERYADPQEWLDISKHLSNLDLTKTHEAVVTWVEGKNVSNELHAQQVSWVKEIQNKIGINVVTCGNCGTVFFHKLSDERLGCPDCGEHMEPCDCPDLYY